MFVYGEQVSQLSSRLCSLCLACMCGCEPDCREGTKQTAVRARSYLFQRFSHLFSDNCAASYKKMLQNMR